jgi:hypothetical protein
MGNRKIFIQTWDGTNTENSRKVIRTNITFFYGISEIVDGIINRSFHHLDNAELLTLTRKQALRYTKDALESAGTELTERDQCSDFYGGVTVGDDEYSAATFVAKLTEHVETLFPELV